ncbi:hypothetical protein [Enterovibrio coralii]|uniref:Uncharacterized protein n=1 Tax=Enterovibrio coralii TaxID=294935 RepID=A0A135I584_9GAMM|nr:hypothetical protein [Enterovibrio coralii]KXF80557.1 hypothetical protein ATN88_07695 [Enterovibrio coralii]
MKNDDDFYAWKAIREKGKFDYFLGEVTKGSMLLSFFIAGLAIFNGVDAVVDFFSESFYWILFMVLAFPIVLFVWQYKEHQYRKECERRGFEFVKPSLFGS